MNEWMEETVILCHKIIYELIKIKKVMTLFNIIYIKASFFFLVQT